MKKNTKSSIGVNSLVYRVLRDELSDTGVVGPGRILAIVKRLRPFLRKTPTNAMFTEAMKDKQ